MYSILFFLSKGDYISSNINFSKKINKSISMSIKMVSDYLY